MSSDNGRRIGVGPPASARATARASGTHRELGCSSPTGVADSSPLFLMPARHAYDPPHARAVLLAHAASHRGGDEPMDTLPPFLDFEASSLRSASYPIEVAWSHPDGSIESHLISPAGLGRCTDWS